MSSSPPRPRRRTLPAWVRQCAWLLVLLMLARAVAVAGDTTTPASAGWIAESIPLELAAVDDDGSDEVLELTPLVACPHDAGTAVVTFARRADALGFGPAGGPSARSLTFSVVRFLDRAIRSIA